MRYYYLVSEKIRDYAAVQGKCVSAVAMDAGIHKDTAYRLTTLPYRRVSIVTAAKLAKEMGVAIQDITISLEEILINLKQIKDQAENAADPLLSAAYRKKAAKIEKAIEREMKS